MKTLMILGIFVIALALPVIAADPGNLASTAIIESTGMA
jgi:hypothetical protein